MAQVSRYSAQYLISQYAFSRCMDAAGERVLFASDERIDQVRSGVLDRLGGSEAAFSKLNLSSRDDQERFSDAFLDSIQSAYQDELVELVELDDDAFRDQLIQTSGECYKRFSETLTRDHMLLLSNSGMPKDELSEVRALRDRFYWQVSAVDMGDLNRFYPGNTLIQNVGNYQGVQDSKQTSQFWRAVSRCPMYDVDPESQTVDLSVIVATGAAQSKWNRQEKPDSDFSLSDYLMMGSKKGKKRQFVEDSDVGLDASDKTKAILAMAEKVKDEPWQSDSYYVQQYNRWKNDPDKIPVPNTSTGCMLQPYDLRLSEHAGQCWSTQHAFGRMIETAEQHMGKDVRFQDSFVINVRNDVLESLMAKGLRFDSLDLSRDHDDNDCDAFVDAVSKSMRKRGLRAGRVDAFDKKLRKGMELGFAEFSKEYFEPVNRRQLLILNTRGFPENYKNNIPAFRNGGDMVGVYVDEIADRFPDQKLISSPVSDHAPEGAVSFNSMLAATPAYELKRLRGRRYVTREPVWAGSQPGPVEAKIIRPKQHDASDLPDIGAGLESRDARECAWYG